MQQKYCSFSHIFKIPPPEICVLVQVVRQEGQKRQESSLKIKCINIQTDVSHYTEKVRHGQGQHGPRMVLQ